MLHSYIFHGYPKVHRAKAFEWYLNSREEGEEIISTIGGVEVRITVEDIKTTYGLLAIVENDISSHVFNEEEMWAKIQGLQWITFNKMSSKKYPLKTEFERILDIIYKCIDIRVSRMYDFIMENIVVMSAILKN